LAVLCAEFIAWRATGAASPLLDLAEAHGARFLTTSDVRGYELSAWPVRAAVGRDIRAVTAVAAVPPDPAPAPGRPAADKAWMSQPCC